LYEDIDLYGLTPVTDSPLHQALMSMKYKRAQRNVSMLEDLSIARRPLELLERYSIIARTVLLEALSPGFLQRLSMAEVLRFRQDKLDNLDRFWTKIRVPSHDLDDTSPGAEYENRLIKLIDQGVWPEIRNLGDTLTNSRKKMFGSLLTRLSASVPASAVMSLFARLSPAQTLALSVGVGIAAFGISVPSAVEYWQERSKFRQNWLSFAMDLRGQAARPE
jgi:hypothetical protein